MGEPFITAESKPLKYLDDLSSGHIENTDSCWNNGIKQRGDWPVIRWGSPSSQKYVKQDLSSGHTESTDSCWNNGIKQRGDWPVIR